ncbi:uncharacterized protein Z519_09287 [Cladophialophora bantiana CBS 173.52]|uniref:NADH dehydrogenase [ubiquinone] 1 alpha subcomplex assembly factor 3 n=1 Tax=Cladophialophora bantiana (strain ATCC 10958 / CBS 173.52 / CDC B-1940 / NIH 8579) TaxID=1442370 RepID=A0A0D2H9A4_CLAB1|nr:uncharacterized protein Z519_09287 [Cladophialophora bantiana CBS 173.52]KIW89858.1 hypothetical protein Z519_09287 [Cladophialophora bantiana CBS 173.52]
MRAPAPSIDLLRALRRAAAAAAAAATASSLHTNPSQAQRPLVISLTRRQTCYTLPFRARHVRPLSTTAPSRQQASSSSSSSSKPATPSLTPTSRSRQINPRAPKHRDRGPPSKEDTQTDFSKMDILASAGVEEPATSIDACTSDGFHLNNGVQTSGGQGVILVGGEAFLWRPWMPTTTSAAATDEASSGGNAASKTSGSGTGEYKGFTVFLDPRGMLNFPPSTLGLLSLLYPKPDLLLVGTGRKLWMLSRETRRYLSEELGIKLDVMDTPNAAAAYNLLVMERGVEEVGSILIPEGWIGR